MKICVLLTRLLVTLINLPLSGFCKFKKTINFFPATGRLRLTCRGKNQEFHPDDRISFSQKRMVYIPAEKSADGIARVVYSSKDGRTQKTFDALDWLASLKRF